MTDPRTGIDLDRSFLDQPFSEQPGPSWLTIAIATAVTIGIVVATWTGGLF